MIEKITTKPLRYLVFDLETAGLDFTRHQIFELGLVACEGDKILDRLGLKLQYMEGPVQVGALKTTKMDIVTWNESAGVLTIQQFCSKFLDFLHRNFGEIGPFNRIVLGGHNIRAFDMGYLQHFIDKVMPAFNISFGHKFGDIFSANALDTMNIAAFLNLAGKFDYREFGLKALLEIYGVKYNKESLHGALADAVLTAELLFAMLKCEKAAGNGDYGQRLNQIIEKLDLAGSGAETISPLNLVILKSVIERIQKGYKLTAAQKQEFENLWREVMA